jgi:hypothetical protein
MKRENNIKFPFGRILDELRGNLNVFCILHYIQHIVCAARLELEGINVTGLPTTQHEADQIIHKFQTTPVGHDNDSADVLLINLGKNRAAGKVCRCMLHKCSLNRPFFYVCFRSVWHQSQRCQHSFISGASARQSVRATSDCARRTCRSNPTGSRGDVDRAGQL